MLLKMITELSKRVDKVEQILGDPNLEKYQTLEKEIVNLKSRNEELRRALKTLSNSQVVRDHRAMETLRNSETSECLYSFYVSPEEEFHWVNTAKGNFSSCDPADAILGEV